MLPPSSTTTTRPRRTGAYQSADGAVRVPTGPRGYTTSSKRAGSAGRASGSSPNHDFGTLPTHRCSEGSEARSPTLHPPIERLSVRVTRATHASGSTCGVAEGHFGRWSGRRRDVVFRTDSASRSRRSYDDRCIRCICRGSLALVVHAMTPARELFVSTPRPPHSRNSVPLRDGSMSAPAEGHLAGEVAGLESSSTRDAGSPDGAPSTGSARSRHRWRRRLLWSLGTVVVVFVAATVGLFISPPTDLPQHVDGILSLNGHGEPAREALAVSLAEKGYAPVLLFSQGVSTNNTPCPKVPRVSVVCFADVTNNTRGEARWAAQYAERHHWHSLLIVPSRTQATRARLLVERCFSGQVVVVPSAEPLWETPADVVHEWGGVLAALAIYRGC